jgi:hypothetical protein
MKRGIILAAAAISMTGAASASLFTTSPENGRPHRSAREKPAPNVTQTPVGPDIRPAAAGLQKAFAEARQPPVPLQMKPRPPVALATVDSSEAYARGEAGVSATSAASDKAGANAARAAIEADGYQGVQVLRQGDDGLWHAKALRGRTEVLLIVDSGGSVTTAD